MANIKGSPRQYGNGKQYSTIQQTGDRAYPPLEIRRNDDPAISLVRYIFLESYSESYKAEWDFSDTKAGDLDLTVAYSVTKRSIDMSFTLAARNVHEAKKNLDFCQSLAKLVYKDYGNTSTGGPEDNPDFIGPRVAVSTPQYGAGATPKYVVSFGTFLREQSISILSFDFEIKFDAGVFDYGSTIIGTIDPKGKQVASVGQHSDNHWAAMGGPSGLIQETEYVYHGQRGGVYPKLVAVKITMLPDEGVSIGFGGMNRAEGSLGWSLSAKGAPRNALLDWPHGTGPIPAAEYCQRTYNDGSGDHPVVSYKDPNDTRTVDENDETGEEDISEQFPGLMKE